MLILLEGVDGSGKSTLAGRLSRAVEAEIRHSGPLTRHPLIEYELDLRDYRVGRDVVYDRHYLGELIYGPLYRGASAIDLAMRRHIELFLASRGALLVHLSPPLEVIEKRLADRGEDFLQSHHIEHVWSEYRRLVRECAMPTMSITRELDGQEDLNTILRYGFDLEKVAQRVTRFPGYVGHRRPDVLLLGERRNDPNDPHQTAFTPYPDASGHFLLRHLPERLLRHVGIANACEGDDLDELWNLLDHPRVVALGREAQRACEDADLRHGVVPHPQWVRRFKFKQGSVYGDLIAAAAITQKDLMHGLD